MKNIECKVISFGPRRIRALLLALGMGALALGAAAQVKVLHSFDGGGDGAWPNGSLTRWGSALYGMTPYGGNANLGVVFKLGADGGTYAVLRHGAASDMIQPWGSLAQLSGTFYATSRWGGSATLGAMFRIGADGGGFALAHSFAGAPAAGEESWSDLTPSDDGLYGMTRAGGAAGFGAVFRINPDGSSPALLHSFSGGTSDGAWPCGGLILAGSTLYGMTPHAGGKNFGTIFRINPDGSGYATLHHFAGGPADGAQPWGALTAAGPFLYGLTLYGGGFGNGALFRMNADGTGYTLLHSFSGGMNDGGKPYGSLTLVGDTLYGMTSAGGGRDCGVIFKISVDGVGYAIVHDFKGGSGDGARPHGALTQSGAALFGMTSEGGAFDRGVAFALPLPASGVRDSRWYALGESGAARAGRETP